MHCNRFQSVLTCAYVVFGVKPNHVEVPEILVPETGGIDDVVQHTDTVQRLPDNNTNSTYSIQ